MDTGEHLAKWERKAYDTCEQRERQGKTVRILLVEDEKKLSLAVQKMLTEEHYAVDAAYTGDDGLDMAESGIYDAIVLDVMLPGMDGFTILKTLREDGFKTPVMMLTARSGLEDRVKGLESGADYYLPKPFQMVELLACLKAITRRGDLVKVTELSFGDILLRQGDGHLVNTHSGQSVKLGNKEYQMLELFLRNPHQILSRDTIAERVWGYDDTSEYNNLEVYVSFLRKKLQFVGSTVKIKATRGMGYSLEEGV